MYRPIRALFVLLDRDGDGMGHFLLEVQQRLFADQFRGNVALLPIGHLIRRIEHWAFGQGSNDFFQQLSAITIIAGR